MLFDIILDKKLYMLVSIILTCYKQEKFIEETILSVVNQRYKNRELLIWDDSPDNNCRNIISKYTKKYPEKIYAWHHYPNKWIVNNMQFLLDQRNKKSEYVAFLEWDDSLFPEYLDKKLEVFKNHPNVQLVYNELTTIDEKWKIINKKELELNNWIIVKRWKINYNELVSNTYYMSRSTLMVKSDVLNKYPIYLQDLWDKTIVSDVYFFNQVANNEDIFGINYPLVYYRIHSDSITKNVHWTVSFCLDSIKYLDYLFKQWFIGNNIYKNQVCRWYLVIAIVSIKVLLTSWVFRNLRIFIEELLYAIKIRFRRLIK